MVQKRMLAIETAGQCKQLLDRYVESSGPADEAVRCAIALCKHIESRAGTWPDTRLHRALGFVQGVLVARGLSSYDDQMAMIDGVKVAFPESRDEELEDHRNPKSPFRLDLGGSE